MKMPDGQVLLFKADGLTINVEAKELVLCKDCKHRFEGEKFPNCCDVLMEMSQWLVEIPVKDEWYCGSGERKKERE